jgi:enoyl-CoA hydratase/carnithine racemase
MEQKPVILEKRGEIGFLILNQPRRGNMLSRALFAGIIEGLEELDVDNEVRLIIVKGLGDHFCYGADVHEIVILDKSKTGNFFIELNKMLLTFHKINKPSIAMVQGYATAGGFSIALSCDIIVASENAHFGPTAVNVGLFCAQTTAVMLPRIIGSKKALEMGLTGDLISAPEAERLGIVNRVVPHDRLESTTIELAEKILSKNPLAIVLGRRAFYDCADMGYAEGLKHAAEVLRQVGISDQAKEGMMAFLAKRKPSYKRTVVYPASKPAESDHDESADSKK